MKECPALLDYMQRIGAEQANFRTWQVKEWKGRYYFERALIKVGPDGTIEADAGYEPSKTEAERIKATWREDMVPRQSRVKTLMKGDIKKTTPGSIFFEFYDDEGFVTFVQERCEPKAYMPWTFWSDGVWRQMQPDLFVPFWMPYPRVVKAKIMIHEGAPAAKAAGEMAKDHPWYDEFKDFEHWGLVGGSMSVRRADYPYLRDRKVQEVVYVCDNDHPGRKVLQNFSRHYGGRLVGVFFDEDFKQSWDCADPLPEQFFNGKRYIGPRFSKYTKPATWATEVRTPEKGRSVTTIRDTFAEEWIHIVTPEVYIHRTWPSKIMGPKEFNNEISPFSQSKETNLLLQKDGAGKGYSLAYNPARRSGPYATDHGLYFNTYEPCKIAIATGSAKPWHDFLEHLIPSEIDRRETERWIATLIAHPEIRILYGLLLVSETQGVGKSTLGEKILKPLIGDINCSSPGETEIVESNWNYWLAHKRLAVVHEIYSGASWKPYNKLKTIITDQYIEVHKKFQADYMIENWIHIIAMSNSTRAIKMSGDDRRWLIPRITEEKKPAKYWTEFNQWLTLEDGLGIILNWAKKFKNIIHQGEEAPLTTAKTDIIEESFGQAQALIYNLLLFLKDRYPKAVITDYACMDIAVHALYEGKAQERLTPLMFRRTARQAGWHIGDGRVKLPGSRERVRLMFSAKSNTMTVEDLIKEGYVMFHDGNARQGDTASVISIRKAYEEYKTM